VIVPEKVTEARADRRLAGFGEAFRQAMAVGLQQRSKPFTDKLIQCEAISW